MDDSIRDGKVVNTQAGAVIRVNFAQVSFNPAAYDAANGGTGAALAAALAGLNNGGTGGAAAPPQANNVNENGDAMSEEEAIQEAIRRSMREQ